MIEQVAVVVPARDEQDALPACLDGLRAAVQELRASRPNVQAQIVLVLDECTDDGVELLANSFDVGVLHVRARTAGGARAAGTAHVLELSTCALEHIWLAHTDADSRVPHDWLVEMVHDAEQGVHVVLGTVEPDNRLDPLVRERWRERHYLIEGHPHVHGANFGIRADAYCRLGGWAALTSGEDVELAARASRAADLVIRRTSRIPVITSSRLVARAPHGFAAYLAALADHPGLVDSREPTEPVGPGSPLSERAS